MSTSAAHSAVSSNLPVGAANNNNNNNNNNNHNNNNNNNNNLPAGAANNNKQKKKLPAGAAARGCTTRRGCASRGPLIASLTGDDEWLCRAQETANLGDCRKAGVSHRNGWRGHAEDPMEPGSAVLL